MNLEDHYEIHPAAKAFPMLPQDELVKLTVDIRDNGLQVPIKRLDGAVLDGRNRLMACLRAGVTPTFEDVQVADPYMWVWSLNGARRHLQSQEQKALIWKKLHGMSEDMQRERARIQAEANAKRAEAAAAQHEVSNPRAGEKTLEDYGSRADCPTTRNPSEDRNKTRQLEASAAGVNTGAIKRADTLLHKAPELADKVAAGEMRYSEAVREAKHAEIRANETPFPSGKYRVIYADPPWKYGNTQPDYHGVQEDHYPLMSIRELCDMDVASIAENDAVLFMWVTSPILEDAFVVIKAWGFKYKAAFVWDKIKHNMGHYNSVRHELLLICTRGAYTPENRKLFDSVVSVERTAHSEKPGVFREYIDTLYPSGERIELFARKKVKGWSVYGNES